MLDLDNMGPEDVKYWACQTCKEFKLGGYRIMRSSKRKYHVVFNRTVLWAENMSIVCLKPNHQGLIKWFLFQCMRGGANRQYEKEGLTQVPLALESYFRDQLSNGDLEWLREKCYPRLQSIINDKATVKTREHALGALLRVFERCQREGWMPDLVVEIVKLLEGKFMKQQRG